MLDPRNEISVEELLRYKLFTHRNVDEEIGGSVSMFLVSISSLNYTFQEYCLLSSPSSFSHLKGF